MEEGAFDPGFDPKYEYDAPMFVDFSYGIKDDEHVDVDSWFDKRDGDDGGFEIDSLEEDSEKEPEAAMPKCDEAAAEVVKEIVKEAEPEAAPEPKVEPEKEKEPISPPVEEIAPPKDEPAPIKRKNVLTHASWSKTLNMNGGWNSNKPAPIKAPGKAPSCEPPAKKSKQQAPPMLTRAKLEAAKAPRRSYRISRKRTDSTCSTMSCRSDVGNTSVFGTTKKAMPKAKKPMLTLPSTPNVLKRPKGKMLAVPMKGHEELELEEISKQRKELQHMKKHNEHYMKKALSNPSYKPVRSLDDPTHAVEFHFATDNRIKANSNQNCPETKEKNFFETLRHHPPSPSFKNRGPTIPQPFSFDNQSRKRKHDEDSLEEPCEGYVSMAQKCYSFQVKTPPRFRTKKNTEQNEGPPPCQSSRRSGSKLTCPKTPNLSSNNRKRPLAADCLSREQEEEKIAEEMRNYKFKAQEFDPKIVEKAGNYGVTPVLAKALTEQQPFNLATDNRGDLYKQKEEVEEKPAPFKAQPVPEFKKMEFKPELQHQVTEAKPFSFEERVKETQAKKEQKIKDIFEEEKKAREFKAQPLQSFSPVGLPNVSKLQATKFAPFNLHTENRGAVKADNWIKMVQDEMQEERKKVAFKAHSSNVLYRPAFVPKKSQKPATVFDDFELNSDRRAEERSIYNMHRHDKEMEENAAQQLREAEREEEERQNIAILRKQLVHKPNPIRKFKPVELLGSDKPLTKPESPAWHTRERKNIRI